MTDCRSKRLPGSLALSVFVAICLVAAPAWADPPQRKQPATKPAAVPSNVTVIYRCTDTAGMLSIQSSPCPKGQRSEREVIAKPAAAVVPLAHPSTPVHAPLTPVPATATLPVTVVDAVHDSAPLPPPPLYRCRTLQDNARSYLSETDTPPPRCRVIPVVNASSKASLPDPAMQNQCVMEQDACERIPDQDLCTAWKQQLAQAQAMIELGTPELLDKATTLRDGAKRIVEYTCKDASK